MTNPAPALKPTSVPTSKPLAINPRFLSDVDSAINVMAPAYSPPVENPCTSLAISNNIGAAIPIAS
ncbi:hypothetical protein BG04_5933 (plasmid) [Priestia megaterium NBRC 15308 = ATCC 14581]|uniref:Uncharacterized protein n=1 Tax=Priestia megaterium (strain ATCC 14581 / DSM 32 / CCUG 1817 / JCM 2506 / NBRC 15308 / NCIMB 9376 / NCTC 10342 / NRRL B-14308 / VKM B-512 / Ford 19) TaxID=1348623 RepID=A0A0B6A9C2_PRIM2|nr:hypothetical protein BG04_5933 [Priestia megaterium NBRC 15308 = ATCC 14581]